MWDEMGSDGMEWDGMGWDGVGWHGIGWGDMGWGDGMIWNDIMWDRMAWYQILRDTGEQRPDRHALSMRTENLLAAAITQRYGNITSSQSRSNFLFFT